MTSLAHEALVFVRAHFHERQKVQHRLQRIRNDFHLLELDGWDSAKRLDLAHALEGLRDHVGMLFALEEADGYLADEIQEAPQLSEQVHILRDQHRRLFKQSCELAEQADRIIHHPRFVHLLESVEEKFEALDAEFSAHELAETELMLHAFDGKADDSIDVEPLGAGH